MAHKRAPGEGEISTIQRAGEEVPASLERCCRGLQDWPRSWIGSEKDLPAGEQLVNCFRPFLESVVVSDLSRKTIQRHVDNIWALGGQLIGELNQNPFLRKKKIEDVLVKAIGPDGGPLLAGSPDEEQQRSFEATCRKLHRFLRESHR